MRPTVPVKGNAKAWWKFAQESVLKEIRAKKEYQKNLPTLRTEYIKLFRLKLRQTTHDEAKLKELERALNAEHIARFRAIAEKEEQQEQTQQTQKQG